MKSSLSTFVFYRYSLPATLRMIKELGYDGVEIWGGRPHAYCEDMTGQAAAGIASLLEELDLPVSNFIPAQFRYPVNIASSDENIRKNSVRYICSSIDTAVMLNTPSISLCPGFSMYDSSVRVCYDQMKKSIGEILQYNEYKYTGHKYNEHKYTGHDSIKILIEPGHPLETDLIVTVEDCLELIDSFGSDKLGVCVDTGHMFVNKENISRVVDQLSGYMTHYHIDDNNGISDDHLVMGEGKIDFCVFLTALEQSGYNGFLAVELGYGYTTDPYPAAKRALEFFNGRK